MQKAVQPTPYWSIPLARIGLQPPRSPQVTTLLSLIMFTAGSTINSAWRPSW